MYTPWYIKLKNLVLAENSDIPQERHNLVSHKLYRAVHLPAIKDIYIYRTDSFSERWPRQTWQVCTGIGARRHIWTICLLLLVLQCSGIGNYVSGDTEASYLPELAEVGHSIQNLKLSELHEHPAIDFLAVILIEQLDVWELRDQLNTSLADGSNFEFLGVKVCTLRSLWKTPLLWQ